MGPSEPPVSIHPDLAAQLLVLQSEPLDQLLDWLHTKYFKCPACRKRFWHADQCRYSHSDLCWTCKRDRLLLTGNREEAERPDDCICAACVVRRGEEDYDESTDPPSSPEFLPAEQRQQPDKSANK